MKVFFKIITLSLLLLINMPLFAHDDQRCNSAIKVSTPNTRFFINVNNNFEPDGTVTDTITKLMWMRCDLGDSWDNAKGECSSSGKAYTWLEALFVAKHFEYADHNDWRLPNIKELNTVVETSCQQPALNKVIFPGYTLIRDNKPSYYWSSTPYVVDNKYVWKVHFGDGNNAIGVTTANNNVRMVRTAH